MIIHVDLRRRSPALRRPHGYLITRLLSLSRRELRSTGPDRHNGEAGRARGGAGGAPGAVRGGGVSESVAKAPRAGIGGEKKRGISTFFLRRSGAIGAFATDLDKRRRHGPREGRRGRLFGGRLVVFPGGDIMKAVRGRLFRGGFEDVGREGRGDGLLGSPPGASGSGCGGIGKSGAGGGPGGGGRCSGAPSPLHLDNASRMVGRRLACRDAPRPASTSPNPRARHPTREHVPLADVLAGQVTCSAVTRRSRGPRRPAPPRPGCRDAHSAPGNDGRTTVIQRNASGPRRAPP